jgi:hypothetical protein
MWQVVDDGKSLGTQGSESGEIILDDEHSNGARITLEQSTDVAPFAITCGIYGSFFHTVYLSTLDESKTKIEIMKSEISDFFKSITTDEDAYKWIEDFVSKH